MMRKLSQRLVGSLFLLSLSTPVLAFLDNAHLENRLTELQSYKDTSLDLDALEREAYYEQAMLSVEQRAWLEGQRLHRQVKEAVLRGYELALASTGSASEAREQVLKDMESEIYLIDEALQDDIRKMVVDVLDAPQFVSQEAELTGRLLESLRERSFQKVELLGQPLQNAIEQEGESLHDVKDNKNVNVNNQTSAALAKALVDDQIESERWMSTSNMTAASGVTTGRESEFSAQVSAEFLGVKLSAGPVFKFKNTVSTYVDLKGEGLYPLFDAQGRFDLIAKDRNGRARMLNGRATRRFMSFTCEASSSIESEAVLKGGFKVAGVGGEGGVTKKFTTSVTLSSRRVLVPDSIDGREALLSSLARICHGQYMITKTSNGKTVRQNLDTMSRNIVSGLSFVNPGMQCVTSNHCANWYNREVIWMHKQNTVPRCIQTRGSDSLMTCQLRGVDRAACAVVKEGKRVSSGMFEYTCAENYRCSITHEGGWFQNGNLWDPWKAECRKAFIEVRLQ
jgi:hypothetical protein